MKKGRAAQAGDLIKINFDPQSGHEQAGWRPALVISEGVYNERSDLALICPITSQVKGYPFEVRLPEDCAFRGVVLADHVKSANLRARGAKHVGIAPKQVLETVRTYVALLIGRK
ncbi:MAG TPA: type II toxin-antitoxin system PemK/MazF family toxin [Bryobacteraceae bacterium]|nr:type II toxin-antitoxin system PemK/MazF family toxin [Bryobacteraceae bacterium]